MQEFSSIRAISIVATLSCERGCSWRLLLARFILLPMADRHRLTELVASGCSVLAAGACAWYQLQSLFELHASPHFDHPTTARKGCCAATRKIPRSDHNPGHIYRTAVESDISSSTAYRLACEAGQHTKHTRYQQRVDSTNVHVDYLRLRLASLTRRAPATVVDIGQRAAYDFEHGLSHTKSSRRRFIPDGLLPRRITPV